MIRDDSPKDFLLDVFFAMNDWTLLEDHVEMRC